MARKLASVVEIETCEPIPETDRLSVATMKGKGWKIVTGRDEFQPGQLCVYFEIDSFLNPNDERYAFLRDRCLRKFVSKSGSILREGLRIKTVKLRGVYSQGLLMPLSLFVGEDKEIKCVTRSATPADVVADDGKSVSEEDVKGLEVAELYFNEVIPPTEEGSESEVRKVVIEPGTDLTKLLKVEHYDEVKEQLAPVMGNPISADAMGRFPTDYIPKTDEERIQNLGDWFEKMKGRKWQVTCKHDGTSCTIAYSKAVDPENPKIVCSRNLRLKPEQADGKIPIYWQMALKYDVLTKLENLANNHGKEYAFQGEIVGPGINKCRNKEMEYKFLVFRVYNITDQVWVNPLDAKELCDVMGLQHVQIVNKSMPFFDEITTMEDALKFAEGKTPEGNEREGVVLKTVDDLPYASFKIVSNKYLMKSED